MDIMINVSEKYAKSELEIHLLPCKINYDGVAEVKSYFSNSIIQLEKASNSNGVKKEDTTEEDEVVLENGLRGRPLNGLRVKLPSSSLGLVLNEEKQNETKRNISLQNSFKSIYCWQLDEPMLSKRTEPFSKALNDWFSIANIIHSD